ncbi:hypothetical protein AB1Y20_007488 [Prymnesium parvum]|uniref:J domain-containing protein n=1 Tax=Prymnesium parvum TaxID=97485 RepID=A0AB34IV06_PRYPA
MHHETSPQTPRGPPDVRRVEAEENLEETEANADPNYLEKLLELKEDRCRRLQALIDLKEARLKSLRSPAPAAPPPAGESPPFLQRQSSSLVAVDPVGRNSAPLGKLQPLGRRDYLPTSLSFGAMGEPPVLRGRAPLQRTGLPREPVRRWHAGQLSADLTMREILDAVCRCSSSSASGEERELYTMTQLYTANGSASLGGTLGGLSGGLPAERPHASGDSTIDKGAHDLCPLRHVLSQPVDVVTNDALLLFARQLLTAAEAEHVSLHGGAEERRALCADLSKLSAEELNLAFRRACLKQQPQRTGGSLAGLLRVHLLFEIVHLVWAGLPAADSPPAAKEEEARSYLPADDRVIIEEISTEEEQILLKAEALSNEELEEFNGRMAAKALYLSKVRDLLDQQLEGLQAVGAYAVLGCDPSASDKELQSHYREAARRLHPDRGGEKVAFQQLQAAYEQILQQRKAQGGAPASRGPRPAKSKAASKKEKAAAAKKEKASAAKAEKRAADEAEVESEGEKKAVGADGEGEAEEKDVAAEAAEDRAEEAKKAEAEASDEKENVDAQQQQEGGSKEAKDEAEGEGAKDEAEGKGAEDEAEGEAADALEEGLPTTDPAAAAAAAEAAARAAVAVEEEESADITPEEMCDAAEQAAEAARACAASSRIGKRVAELGVSGWGVLCDCAQCVLRTGRSAASNVSRVGNAAMQAPDWMSDTLDAATGRQLNKRAERELRSLMEDMVTTVRQGRCAVLAANVCTAKAADAAQIVLSLIRLPPNPERLTSAVGAAAISSLMARVADVLSEITTAVGEAAEYAMSTAVAVAAMQRKAELVRELAEASDEKSPASENESDDDEAAREAREAREKAARDKAAAEAAGEGQVRQAVRRRLENARWMKKLHAEVGGVQSKIRLLVTSSPQLLPGITVAEKEALFQQLVDVLTAAEQPVTRRWYQSTWHEGGGGGDAAVVAEWCEFVQGQFDFIGHAASRESLPVPTSLAARLLRQCALVDGELTHALCTAALQRVLLFAPDTTIRDLQLLALRRKLSSAITTLVG